MSYKKLQFLLGILIFTASGVLAGNIKGKIYDSATKEGLPAATIVIEGTNMGYVTDLRGEFTIANIAAGEHRLLISYIGYESKIVTVNVLEQGVTELEISIVSLSILGQEVTVTAQASGQRAAINQQVNSNSVTNVVSAQRIQEIPESSAAEAVGRLPGVSVNNGSIVVRGLSPHYNKIQVDGIDMASTSFSDRSSSLDMISQYMLEGIEMTKTAMAEHDADVLGARVNLMIKEAPLKSTFEVLFQNGYNTLSNSLANQKFSLSGSHRFFNNKLGIFSQISYDRSNWATNSMGSGFSVTETAGKIPITGVSLGDAVGELLGRKGFSLVMDYKTGLTKIKSSNFISNSITKNTTNSLGYSSFNKNESRTFNTHTQNLLVMTNSLRIEQIVGRFELDGGVSHAYSKNELPESISIGANDLGAISNVGDSIWWQNKPLQIPEYSEFNLQEAFLGSYEYKKRWSKERKYSADINIKTNLKFGDKVNLELKAGGKYKYLKKESDNEYYEAQLNQAYFQKTAYIANEYLDWFPTGNEAGSPEGGFVSFQHFVNPNYSNNEFLLTNTSISHIFDENKVREFHDFMWENPMNFAFGEGEPYYKLWKNSFADDYYGHEEYWAAYVMPTLTIGRNNMLTFIPGVRYEKNKTSYTGYRLPQTSSEGRFQKRPEFGELSVTRDRLNEYVLPMIHLIYRPLKWAVIKSSYTHTLSRPQFRNIIPSWDVGIQSIAWNNPYLEPAYSKNIDVNISIHGNKLGLFTVGVFQKEIEKLIFSHGATQILQEELDANKYDGLQNNDEYTFVDAAGYLINYEMNNPRTSYVKGLELEYQSNFYFLPGALKGLVFNVNYTLFDSEAKYPSINRILDFQTFRYTYVDTFFVARLIDQSRNIFNVMLGFDYKGFSIRGSLKYTDDMFSKNHPDPRLRADTDSRIDIDLSIKQNLPKMHVSLFCNATNLTGSKYRVINRGTGYPVSESWGGIGIELGARYRFKQE